MPHLLHISNGNGNGNGMKGGHGMSTDGLILHHGHDGGHHAPPPPHININMPKYIHGAGILPPGKKSFEKLSLRKFSFLRECKVCKYFQEMNTSTQ